MKAFIDTFNAPVGTISAATVSNGALLSLRVGDNDSTRDLELHLQRRGYQVEHLEQPDSEVRAQFADYFGGQRIRFDLPLFPQGSAFERAVWKELEIIPYGETTTYGEIASAIGFTGEARRVGAACGANPWLLVVPCHRVIAADGSLRGYAAGLDIKEKLLAFERGQPSLLLAS